MEQEISNILSFDSTLGTVHLAFPFFNIKSKSNEDSILSFALLSVILKWSLASPLITIPVSSFFIVIVFLFSKFSNHIELGYKISKSCVGSSLIIISSSYGQISALA